MYRIIIWCRRIQESGRSSAPFEVGRLSMGSIANAKTIAQAMLDAAEVDNRLSSAKRNEYVFGFAVCKFVRDWADRAVWINVEDLEAGA